MRGLCVHTHSLSGTTQTIVCFMDPILKMFYKEVMQNAGNRGQLGYCTRSNFAFFFLSFCICTCTASVKKIKNPIRNFFLVLSAHVHDFCIIWKSFGNLK